MKSIKNLKGLFDFLKDEYNQLEKDGRTGAPNGAIELAKQYGLPISGNDIDFADLPTFGGEEPSDTSGVWSWDKDNLLVGTCVDDMEIVSREECGD